MVTVILRGGLGNQMFQYAAGLSLAKRNKESLFLDTTFLNDRLPRREFTYRSYDLDVFQLVPRFTSFSKISAKMPIPGLWLGLDLVLARMISMVGGRFFMKESSMRHIDPRIFSLKANAVLWGHWQSEKYFSGDAQEVKSAFRFKEELSGNAAVLGKEIKNVNSVSIHIRRGDYIKYASMKKEMGDTDLSYYSRAISYAGQHISDPHFFIFSDDIAWCKEHLNIGGDTTYVDGTSAGNKNAQHMQLMSLCKHNIIANSTFSWWGAWLNANPEKIVIAPDRWYADGEDGKSEIIPDGWIKL